MRESKTLGLLFRSLPHWGRSFFWLGISTLSINLLSLAIPIFFMQVYDRILPTGTRTTLVWMTVAVIMALILEAVISLIRRAMSLSISNNYSYQAETTLMERIKSLTPREFHKMGYSAMDRKFRHIQEIANFYQGQFFQSLLDFPFILLFLGGIYFYGGKLVYFHLILIAMLIPFYLFMAKLLKKSNLRLSNANQKRFQFLTEILSKIHFLKSQAYEENLLRKGEAFQDQYALEELKQNNLTLIPQTVGGLFSLFMVYGTILIGGILVLKGDMSLGLVTASTMLARRAISPIQNLSRFILKLSRVQGQLTELEQDIPNTMNLKVDNSLKWVKMEGHYIMNNLHAYSNEERNISFSDYTFQANRGSITAFLGEPSEKMELFRDLLLGFQKPDKGIIVIDSLRVSEQAGCYLSSQFALLPRNGRLYNGTLLENIAGFDPALSMQALEAASLFGLDPLIANLPRGYETAVRSQSRNTLSPAIMQRISLAKAFVSRPRIIVSDFCDDWMDKATLSLFTSILKRNRNSCTVLMLSRRAEILSLADQVYELEPTGLKEVLYE